MTQPDLTLGAEDIYPPQRALFDAYVDYYKRTVKEHYDSKNIEYSASSSGDALEVEITSEGVTEKLTIKPGKDGKLEIVKE